MAEQPDNWVKETLDSAIHEIISTRQFDAPVIEQRLAPFGSFVAC